MTGSVEDQLAVVETVYSYAWGVDRRDWEGYRAIFDTDVLVDFSSWNGRPAATVSADDWVANLIPLFRGLDASQHSMTNPRVRIDDDHAVCEMYVVADHVLGEKIFTVGGYYVDTLVRRPDGWRLSAITLNVQWERGDRSVMDTARELGERAQVTARELGERARG